MSALPGLFSFEGRARRSEWWLVCIGAGFLGGQPTAKVYGQSPKMAEARNHAAPGTAA